MPSLPFESKKCPETCGQKCEHDATQCPIFGEMPAAFQEICKDNAHLLRYLNCLPTEKIGVPQYVAKLNRSMRANKNRNLIYPVDKKIFIHILANPEDIRDHYIAVEPCLSDDLGGIVDSLDERLADHVDELGTVADAETTAAQRFDAIMKIVNRLVTINDNGKNGNNGHRADEGRNAGGTATAVAPRKTKDKIDLSRMQYNSLVYQLQRKLDGLGVLQPMICDPNIEDISCSGLGNIFVEHKMFGGLRTSIGFATHAELDKFVIQLAESIKHPVTFRNPTVDATLQDGSRINIVYGTDVSKRGSNFTIRKFSGIPMSIIELIQGHGLSPEMAA